MTLGHQRQSGAVLRITVDRSSEKIQRQSDAILLPGDRVWEGAQIQIVGREIDGWPLRRSSDFGSLQCRLDDASNADCDLVLKFEDVFQRAIEPLCPEMSAGFGFDQLRGDAHPATGFANRAFEQVSYPQFTPDLPRIDTLPLVGETRIAGDDEQPADAGQRSDDLLDHA